MNKLIKIGNQEIAVKEYQGQRVVTFRDIDIVHERVKGTAKRNFNENIDRLKENIDYFSLSQKDENRTLGIDIPNRGITVITERGYLMLVKSFTDDLAWEVQGQLVDTYFCKSSKPLTQEEIMRVQLSMIDNVSDRVDKLENTMIIDYGQQQALKKLVNKVALKWLGGMNTPAYKEIGRKVFSECNRDIQDRFYVNSRNNVPRLKYEEVCDYIKAWEPCTNTKMLIHDCNAQYAFVGV